MSTTTLSTAQETLLSAMRTLCDYDRDYAREINGVGFSKRITKTTLFANG